MNWTEGNLARHSRGRQRNKLIERQKQHFARARNSLLKNPARQSPIVLSLYDHDHATDRQGQIETSGASSRWNSSPSRHEYRKKYLTERTHPDLGVAVHPKDHVHSSKTKHGEKQLSSETISRKKKRPRDSEIVDIDNDQSDMLREKKQRLLGKTDWVGLSMQQPLEIAFPGQWDRNDGPRWSKTVENQPSRKTRKTRHLVDRSALDDNIQGPYYNPGSATQRDQRFPLRIQIGSQEIQPSATTASQASIKRYSLAPRSLHKFSAPFSDQARQDYVSRSSEDRTATNKSCLLSSGQRGPETSRLTIKNLLDRVKAPLANEVHVPKIVYSSSIIHEPTPRRANDFMVLQWSPSLSEKAESLQVHLGRDEPVVPASQIAENEKWKQLLASSDKGSESMTQGSSHDASLIGLNTSPGVSALPSHLEVYLPPLDPVLDPSSSRISSNPLTSHPSSESTSLAHLSKELSNDSDASFHSGVCSTRAKASSPEEAAKGASMKAEQALSAAPARNSQTQSTYEDEQDAWMKFVFGSDEDGLQDKAFQDAAKQAAYELKPSDTSNSTDDLSLINNVSASDATRMKDDIEDFESVMTCGTARTCPDKKFSDEISSAGTSDESHVATRGTVLSDSSSESSSANNNLADAHIHNQSMVETGFRFAHPRTFVGKFVGPNAMTTAQTLPFHKTNTGPVKGKRKGKKKASDGRPNIRDFPDFNDDPIEESDQGC